MADDIAKVTSMRLNEEDLTKFKEFAVQNKLNQQQAFNSLIALAELERTKYTLGDRAKEVESFRDTINRAIGMYINSLEINQTTEERIREELSQELKSKDNTISALQLKNDDEIIDLKYEVAKVKDELKVCENGFKNAREDAKAKSEQLIIVNESIADKSKAIEIANRNNATLQEQLDEYKQYKTQYKELEKKLDHIKTDNATLTTNNIILENTVTEYQGKLNNSNDMNKFYINNITDLKKDIEEYKAERKSLEDKHTKEIIIIKTEHTQTLESQLNLLEKQYNNRLEIEVARKNLEIEQLNNKNKKTTK